MSESMATVMMICIITLLMVITGALSINTAMVLIAKDCRAFNAFTYGKDVYRCELIKGDRNE